MTVDMLPGVMGAIAPQVQPPESFSEFRMEQGELDVVNAAVNLENAYATEVIGAPQPIPNDGSSLDTFAGNNWNDVDYARSTYGLRGSGQTVAVIDSGIAYDHYALGKGFGAGTRVVGGWDFAENDANPYDDGPSGFHGTHVAGIIGSSDTTYTGIAPGADLVALRVFDDNGNGNFAWVENALRWVHEHRADFASPITTVNLSLGAGWNSHTIPNWAMLEDEFAQLEADGVFIAVAAGNSFAKYNAAGLSYPGVSPNVVPVMSVDALGNFSSFSQRATRALAAPGQKIVSTVPDYLNGANGIPNDFASASGTSMASPYLAGVSTLVRQSMRAFGRTAITQDMIFDHLRTTADSFYDSVTKDNYLRVNVRRALDSLAGADTFGNSAATATAKGVLANGGTVSGQFNTLADSDYFSFVAERSGVLQLNATSAGGSLTWTVVGGSGAAGNQLSLNVVAGQTYKIGLTNTAIGNYSLAAAYSGGTPVTPPTELGTVDYLALNNVAVSGSRSYSFRAAHSAYLVVEGRQAAGTGVTFDVLAANGQVLRTATVANGFGRGELIVSEGQSYTLRVNGTTSDVDFKLVNLYALSADRLEIFGTANNDEFWVNAEAEYLSLNGVGATLTNVTNVVVHGGGGSDLIYIIGSTKAAEQGTATSAGVTLTGGGLTVQSDGFENSRLYLQRADTATLVDSRGNDAFWVYDRVVAMLADGVGVTTIGAGTFVANATAGGADLAYLYPTAGTPNLNRIAATINANNGSAAITLRGIETAYAVGGSGLAALGTNAQTASEVIFTPYDLPWVQTTHVVTAAASPGVTNNNAENTSPPLSAPALEMFDAKSAAVTDAVEALQGDITERFARGGQRAGNQAHAVDHDELLADWDIADTLGH